MQMTAELTPQAQQLLTAVKAASVSGQWARRADIAKAMGKDQLNAGDKSVLALLASMGYVEQQEAQTNAPSGKRFEYRAISK